MNLEPAHQIRALLAALVLASSAALASDDKDFVIREYTIPLEDIDEIEIHASVGTLEILPLDANEVRIVLEIEANDDGWFQRRRDVSDVELEQRVRGKRLVLEQTEKGTNTEWTVQMPAVARTKIEMGVGEIEAELDATALELELGVGDVELLMPRASTGRIDISVGVGEARLRGADDVTRKEAFVSQDIRGRGEGDAEVRIEVGVGDVELELL